MMAFQNVPTRQPTRRTSELLLIIGAWGLGVIAALQIGWALCSQ